MVRQVKIRGTPNEIMDIVRDLRATGLSQGHDFDFSYRVAQWTDILEPTPQHAIFIFYTEKYAMFFSVKHSDRLI
jgi:hypothetical protein